MAQIASKFMPKDMAAWTSNIGNIAGGIGQIGEAGLGVATGNAGMMEGLSGIAGLGQIA